MSELLGRYDILEEGMQAPSVPLCMTCNSVMATEMQRLKVDKMRDALIIQDLNTENKYLENKLRETSSSLRRIISMALLLCTTFFTFADSMPELPRRIPRGRRREESAT